jgi:hypothetical protein
MKGFFKETKINLLSVTVVVGGDRIVQFWPAKQARRSRSPISRTALWRAASRSASNYKSIARQQQLNDFSLDQAPLTWMEVQNPALCMGSL